MLAVPGPPQEAAIQSMPSCLFFVLTLIQPPGQACGLLLLLHVNIVETYCVLSSLLSFVVLAVAVSGLSKFPTVVIEPGVSPSGSISSASHVLVVSSA